MVYVFQYTHGKISALRTLSCLCLHLHRLSGSMSPHSRYLQLCCVFAAWPVSFQICDLVAQSPGKHSNSQLPNSASCVLRLVVGFSSYFFSEILCGLVSFLFISLNWGQSPLFLPWFPSFAESYRTGF